ncbi:MAG: ribose-phosphate pyrophosphokinase [Aigarchaeota archaeon]|nr:ribose-phosphate pyrophosphokinase [Candidatus Pelearchaeum maunauluense]
MLLIPGPASRELGEAIARLAQLELGKLEFKLFPDGESYLRLESSVEGREVAIVQGTHPPQDRHIMQLLLMVDNLKNLGASRIVAIIPYMAYARQDKRFLEGEAISIETILKMFKYAGIDEIITVNIHSPWILQHTPIPVANLDATGLLAKYTHNLGLSDPLIISPGKKGEAMASIAAKEIGTDFAPVRSERNTHTGEVKVIIEADVKDRDVLFVDDIISTGGTAIKTVKTLKKLGSGRIVVSCIHALMVGDADKRLLEAGAEKLVATNTIPNRYAEVDIASLIAQHVKRE